MPQQNNTQENPGIDDVLTSAGVEVDNQQEPPKTVSIEDFNSLQKSFKELQATINTNKSMSKMNSQRDIMVDRFTKAVAMIEKAGIGEYDSSTGEIKVKEKDTTPDYDTRIKDIDKQISKAHLLL